jgi:drug/metabolite transporter (DMT)-like permease
MPAAWGLARGESPGTAAIVGMALAIVAIATVSLAPGQDSEAQEAAAILLALGAGLLFGVFFIALALTHEDAGLWPVPLSRTASAASLLALALVMTRGVSLPRQSVPAVGLIAGLEVAAAATLLLALQRGPVSVAAVLASLYPVTTVLLAAGLLRERLNRAQMGGVALAFVAVVLVSTG